MTHICAVVIHKGGVGKSTTTVNLAAAASGRFGLRTLIVDMEPQRNATVFALGQHVPDTPPTVEALLDEQATLAEVVVATPYCDRLHVVPGSGRLERWAARATLDAERTVTSAAALRRAVQGYDLVLIDTPPSRGQAAECALTAGNSYLVVTQCELGSVIAIGTTFQTAKLAERENPDLWCAGVVMNLFRAGLPDYEGWASELRQRLPHRLYEPPIPAAVEITRAQTTGVPPEFIRGDEARGARTMYRRLAEQFLTRIGLVTPDAVRASRHTPASVEVAALAAGGVA